MDSMLQNILNELENGFVTSSWQLLHYFGATSAIAYWYFLELNAAGFDHVLINPIFIWITIGFFLLLEQLLFKGWHAKQEAASTVTIYSERKKTVLEKNKKAYIESRGYFTLVMMNDGHEMKNNVRISEWEMTLDEFLRIHRSFLVNPKLAILKGNEVIINSEWTLPISRSYKTKVLAYFQN